MISRESVMENREPSRVIVAYLMQRISQGHIFHPTDEISDGTGLSRKTIGVRMGDMARSTWHGLRISRWSECVWKAEVKDESRAV